MTIYVVFYDGSYEISEFVAAFSTREKAETYIKGCHTPWGYHIEDHDLDER